MNGDKIKSYNSSQDGWTFMETLIVIAIVLILTTSVGVMAIRYLDKAKIVTARTQIDSFSIALEAFYIDNGRYPTQEQGLDALWKKPVVEPVSNRWNGPYLYKKIPNDPWGRPYNYIVPGPEGLPYGIFSYGSDGKEGGSGNDADIQSWTDLE